jgi:8-oxo-dGTP pyrophosphatase MutT (NUDIX family)
MKEKWKVLKSKKVFDCPWFKVFKETCSLPDGKIINDYFVTESSDIVTIIPFIDKSSLILLKEYKHGYGDYIYTFPSGMMEKGETPLKAAKRELLEETGYKGTLFKLATTYPNPTSSRFKKTTFIATDLVKTNVQKLDMTEFIEVHIKSLNDILELIDKNKIGSDLNLFSFYQSLRYLKLMEIKE